MRDPATAPTASIGAMLARRALLSRDRSAVVSGDARVTFGELDARVNRAAVVLRRLGIGPGDRVGLMLRNGLAFCELFYAIGRIGAICCPVNHRLSAAEIAVVFADSEPRQLIYDTVFDSTVEALRQTGALDDTPALPLTSTRAGGDSYEHRLDSAANGPVDAAVDPGDALLLVYTSGTTGRPKGALITHEQLFWGSLTIGHTVDFRSGDVHLLPVPMFHVGGLSFTVHVVHAGATAIIPPAWNAGEILTLIETAGVNHFFAVPTMLADLIGHPQFAPERLGSVRWIMSGAAPLPADLAERYSAFGIPVQQSYGATETCGPALCVDVDHVTSKPGSIGLPFFHTDVRIVCEDGREAAAGEAGEIIIRARHVFSGYWRNPDATRSAFAGDWFRTGDIGYRDGDGYAYVIDRKNDLIISGGENVYPREVEQVIERHEAVATAAVIPLCDERWGEIVCAFVTLKSGQTLDLDELTAHCAPHLARYKVPKRLIVRDELPRNATGKVLRAALRREVAAG